MNHLITLKTYFFLSIGFLKIIKIPSYMLYRKIIGFGGTINIQFVRPFLNKLRGVKIGKKVSVGDDACIGLTYPELIEIGDNLEFQIV